MQELRRNRMKNIKLFAIISVLAVLVSCNNGLTKQTDKEEGLVAFSLEFDGKTISSNNTRNIGIDSVEDALKDFVFTVNLINKEDSSKNQNMSGKISAVSLFLQYLSLAKGSWTVKIDGSHPDKDSHISGSTDFTVGGHEAFFILKLQPSGSAKGCIEYNTRLGKVEENQKAILYPLEKYLSGTIEDGDGIVYEYPDEANPPANAYKLYANLNPDVIVLEDVTPGNYFLQIKSDNQIKCGDVAYVYPGLTSKGVMNEGKSNLFLDYGYVYQDILGSTETINVIEFENGIAKLPGYGSIEDGEREPVRPGYIFTGWYDSKEAANIGLWPSVPIEDKFISQETYPGSGAYNIGDRTLYAGWKKVDIDNELLKKNLFFVAGNDSYEKVIFKDSLQNYPAYDSDKSNVIMRPSSNAQFVASGDYIYAVEEPSLFYVDYSTIQEGQKVEMNEVNLEGLWNTLLNDPTPDDNINKVMSIFNNNDEVYVLGKYSIEGGYDCHLFVAKVDKDNEPQLIATQLSGDEDIIDSNCTLKHFAIKGDKVFLTYNHYTNGKNLLKVARYSLQTTTETVPGDYILKKEKEIIFNDYYESYLIDYKEDTDKSTYADTNIQEIYIDNGTVYFLVDENSYKQGNFNKNFVSTGAVVEFDTDLNYVGTYGRVMPDSTLEIPAKGINAYTVSHSYDLSAFTGPKKILGIYKRKMIIQEEGAYPYAEDKDGNYLVKHFLRRISVFDLEKKCMEYTQVTDLDMLQSSVINLSESPFRWD